jgi:hypothetical protein
MADYGNEQLTDLSHRVGLVMFDVLHQLVDHCRSEHETS